jgi:hypothetical protein
MEWCEYESMEWWHGTWWWHGHVGSVSPGRRPRINEGIRTSTLFGAGGLLLIFRTSHLLSVCYRLTKKRKSLQSLSVVSTLKHTKIMLVAGPLSYPFEPARCPAKVGMLVLRSDGK